MANVTITQLPPAGPITGTESVPVVQNGQTVRTTTGAIAAAPAQTQTFLTINQEPTLPNSRYLSTSTGIGLVDGGPQSFYRLTLNAASGSLEVASNGIIAKTASNAVAARSIAVTGAGLTITDGDGVAGNPTLGLTGLPLALANTGGTGFLAVVGGTVLAGRQIYGTPSQIDVTDGNGSNDPVLSLSANPVIPGTGAMRVPVGTNAQQPVGVNGQIRYNSDSSNFEGYSAGTWNAFTAGGNITIGTTSIALGGSSLTLGGLTSVTVTQDPLTAFDLATKQYVDTVAEGLHIHAACAAATPNTLAVITGGTVTYNNGSAGVGATLTLSNPLTVLDGYTLQNGDRVLVKNEAAQANNGIYTWATGGTVLTRATDFDTAAEIAGGDFTFVTNGTLYDNTGWVQTDEVTTVGTDPIVFVQFSGAGSYASNLTGGTANQIPYQTAPSTTSFITAPTVASTVLQWNGSAFQWATVTTAPAGANTEVQFNNAGAFGASANLTFDGSKLSVYGVEVGRGAGAVATNTAVGTNSLQANTTGSTNVAVGYQASYSNITGNFNTVLGYQALYSSTTAISNVAVGYAASYKTTTGTGNTALGYQALYENTSNAFNTAVGNAAAQRMLSFSNVAVGASAMAGGFPASGNSGYQNVAVGTSSLGSLTSGANNVAVGQSALGNNSTASNVTAVGMFALYYSNGADQVAVGKSAAENNTGYQNVAVGVETLYGNALNPSLSNGYQNVAVGWRSLYNNTTGFLNTAVGYQAGGAMTTGGSNTIIGAYTGNQNGLDIRTSSNRVVIADGAGNRIISGGSGLSVALGNSAVPQSGTGITFPASQSSSSNVNTLDDYEEGTFTPFLQGSSGTTFATYGSRNGYYTKIGDLVFAMIWISLTSGSFSGNMQVGGLPFNARNVTNGYGPITIGYVNNYSYNTYYQLGGYVSPAVNYIWLSLWYSGAAGINGPLDGAFDIMLSVTYKTDT